MSDEKSMASVPCTRDQGSAQEGTIHTPYKVVGTVDLRVFQKAGEGIPRTLWRIVDMVRARQHALKIGTTACGRGVYVHRGVTERQPVCTVACCRIKAEGEHYLDVYDTEVLRLLEAATARSGK